MAEMLRILAVDDEPLALRRVELLLARIPQARLVATSLGGEEATKLVDELKPSVILLDIKMAGFSGFDVVERLNPENAPAVIFVTAFGEFALKAFEVGAVDYVLKPVELGRLQAALDRARRTLETQDAVERLEDLKSAIATLRREAQARETPRGETEVWVEKRNEYVRVGIDALEWIEAERDYIRLHTARDSYLLRETISNFAERLDPGQFARIRRSAIVKIGSIMGVRRAGYGDFRVVLSGGAEIRVGRTYVGATRQLISPRTPVLTA